MNMKKQKKQKISGFVYHSFPFLCHQVIQHIHHQNYPGVVNTLWMHQATKERQLKQCLM